MKPFLHRWYTVLIKRKLDLQRQVEALQQDNAQLRARLATAQNAKLVAENQADELRERRRSASAQELRPRKRRPSSKSESPSRFERNSRKSKRRTRSLGLS